LNDSNVPVPNSDSDHRADVGKAEFARRVDISRNSVLRILAKTAIQFDYGVHNGTVKLLTYQVPGERSQKLPNWRWMETVLISIFNCSANLFRAACPGITSKHHKWDKLFIRVKLADKDST
jgi:hypothetical protein